MHLGDKREICLRCRYNDGKAGLDAVLVIAPGKLLTPAPTEPAFDVSGLYDLAVEAMQEPAGSVMDNGAVFACNGKYYIRYMFTKSQESSEAGFMSVTGEDSQVGVPDAIHVADRIAVIPRDAPKAVEVNATEAKPK
jgi:hypothetical protein